MKRSWQPGVKKVATKKRKTAEPNFLSVLLEQGFTLKALGLLVHMLVLF
ncbi:MAG: hypothetical protein P9M03_09515 [Candidatus Theseobacter exili]|nr:hypothetical protein [Candidatus Theseobacter exili]